MVRAGPQEPHLAALVVLPRHLLQRAQNKGRSGRRLRSRIGAAAQHLLEGLKLDELKVVKGATRQLVVEAAHLVPRAIAHADDDDGEWRLRRGDDRVLSNGLVVGRDNYGRQR